MELPDYLKGKTGAELERLAELAKTNQVNIVEEVPKENPGKDKK